MKILIYNHFHIGDLLFNQPIIRNLCNNNPQHTFTMYCNYNSYIFKDIPNLTVDISGIFPRPPNIFFDMIDPNTISINMWIAAIASYKDITKLDLKDIECNIHNYVIAFKKMIDFIKNRYNIIINLEEYNDNKYLPIIPDTDIMEFIDWNNNRTDKRRLVFYYNYHPKSGQTIPIDNHNLFIIEIAKVFTNYIFLLPNFSQDIEQLIINHSITNIISCEKKFNCKEDITCKNLCMIQKILDHCDFSIHFDIGACFYYINNNTISSKNIPIHISTSEYYTNNLYKNSINIKNKANVIISTNVVDTYLKLEDILNN